MEREIYGMEQRMLTLTMNSGAAKVLEIPFEIPFDKVLAMLLAAEGEKKSNWGLDSNQALFARGGPNKDNNHRKNNNRGKSYWNRGKRKGKKTDRDKGQRSSNYGNDDRYNNCGQVGHYKRGYQQKRQKQSEETIVVAGSSQVLVTTMVAPSTVG